MSHERFNGDFAPLNSFGEAVEDAVQDIRERYVLEDANKGVKATIYSKTAVGSIGKEEGYVKEVSKNGVTFIPARARRERMIMSYYAPFWMVVAGWGHPSPDKGSVPMTSNDPNVEISRARYRSQDNRWVTDFLEGPGKGLKPLAMLSDRDYSNPGKLPEHDPDAVGG